MIRTALLVTLLLLGSAQAQPLTFQMSWRPQAEQGGYYQALVRGFYAACGIEMRIRPGGPGIDTTQLLAGNAIDVALVPQNDGVMRLVEAGFPARAVMAAVQKFPSILMAHAESGVNGFADMRGRAIMISQPNRVTFWPLLRTQFGFTDSQLRSYSGQIAVWMNDRTAIQQGLITNEPFLIRQQTGADARYFLLADAGYTPYSSVVAVSQKMIDERPQTVQCLVDASRRGWVDHLADPRPAFAQIQRENPQNSDALMAYTFATMRDRGLLENEDTARLGFGAITAARWQAHAAMLIENGLFKPDFDVGRAFTTRFVEQPIP